MKLAFVVLAVAISVLTTGPAPGAGLEEQLTVRIDQVGLHPGMPPGMYVCAGGHLHIQATVHNQAQVPVNRITVAGTAFDAAGTPLGTATASPQPAVVAPDGTAQVDLEFLSVTGPLIQRAVRHELAVIEVHVAP